MNYNSSWKENIITRNLVKYIKNNNSNKSKYKIDIVREFPLDDYQEEEIDADETPRIDFRFSKWKSENFYEYFIEEKNLCEKDWIKENGSNVSSSKLLNRYINTGIEHFFTNYYPLDGCLCGYIMQGDLENIISKLNFILEKKSYNQLLLNNKSINNYNQIYTIKKDNYSLLNIFFYFNK
ncbi:MAG TPA: hypothetical protein PK762_01800 [Candidatus Kapabacteria bacterium]|nr:hypothetical protein [Candidatus Kapabacteria bacterium]